MNGVGFESDEQHENVQGVGKMLTSLCDALETMRGPMRPSKNCSRGLEDNKRKANCISIIENSENILNMYIYYNFWQHYNVLNRARIKYYRSNS